MNYQPKYGKHLWRGENVGYHGIHKWLKKHHGTANHCENVSCPGISTRFEWAKLSEKEYERKRENFWQLCKHCHSLYDRHIQNLAVRKHKKVIASYQARDATCHSHFGSIKEAVSILGVSKSSISNALRGKSQSAGGYKWKYA